MQLIGDGGGVAGNAAAVASKAAAEVPEEPGVEQEKTELAEKAADKPVEKKPVVCATAPRVSFSDGPLEKEIRRKASKPEGELTVADLRKVRSVDLTRSPEEIESLDPCVFPQLTSLRHLYIGKGSITDLTPGMAGRSRPFRPTWAAVEDTPGCQPGHA